MIDTKLIELAIRDKDFLAILPDDLRKQISKVCNTCASDAKAKKALYSRIHTEFQRELLVVKEKIKQERKHLGHR